MRGAQGLVRTPIYFLTQLLFIPCLNNIRPSCPVLSCPTPKFPIPSVTLSFSDWADTTGLLRSLPACSLSIVFSPTLSSPLSYSHRSPHYNFTGGHQTSPHYPSRQSKKTKHSPPKRPKKTDWDDVRPKKTYGWNLKLFSGEGQSKNSNRWLHWNQSSAGHHEKKEINKQFNLLLNIFFYEFACS